MTTSNLYGLSLLNRSNPIRKTIEEEIALCKAFVAKSEDSVQGNGKKVAGFWREVAERFQKNGAKTKKLHSEDRRSSCGSAPIGRDRAKKKGSSSGAHSETSIAGDPSLVDALLKRKCQEQGELERLRIAQRDKELDLQQKIFEFQQQQKFEEDLKYYNEDHDHLTGRALSTALFLKKKIKERWNLDY
ncbi:hypothetical protein Tco_0385363 [Tanacetum coccineum]